MSLKQLYQGQITVNIVLTAQHLLNLMPRFEQSPTIETPTLFNHSNTESQKAGYTLSLALLSNSACTQASDIQVRTNNIKRGDLWRKVQQ